MAQPDPVTVTLHLPTEREVALPPARLSVLLPLATAPGELAVGAGPPVALRLRAGTVTLVPPGPPATLRTRGTAELLLLSVAPGHAAALAPGVGAAPVPDLEDDGVAALGQELRRSLLSDALSAPAYHQALADAVLVRLACLAQGEGRRPPRREALSPGVLAKLVRHVDGHLDGPLRVEELADLAGLSRSHFSRAFQRMTGDTPQCFILKRRLCRARDLLAAGEASLAQVAARTGFSSQAHMATAFRRSVGMTPGGYRAAMARDPEKV